MKTRKLQLCEWPLQLYVQSMKCGSSPLLYCVSVLCNPSQLGARERVRYEPTLVQITSYISNVQITSYISNHLQLTYNIEISSVKQEHSYSSHQSSYYDKYTILVNIIIHCHPYLSGTMCKTCVVVPFGLGPHFSNLKLNNNTNVMITSTFITMFKRHRFKGTRFKGTQVWV